MTSITPFRATDILKMGTVNLDVLTENYNLSYYIQYLCCWPAMMFKSATPSNSMSGYMIGKSEGQGKEWHSHITAVTVDYDYRRLGIAKDLVAHLEHVSEEADQDCYFMDLYVRASNRMAIEMYNLFGFKVFRRVVGYYGMGNGDLSDSEDAFDMRKPLKRDPNNSSLKKSSHTLESPYYTYDYKNITP